MKVLVTGANGFIGRALCAALAAGGHRVVASLRREDPGFARRFAAAELRVTGDIGAATDWSAALAGADAVVHLANLAHVARADAAAFEANIAGTRALAAAARARGVRRLVYLSSIKVHGETSGANAFSESSPLAPETPYARSKLLAERALAEGAGVPETVILRPPLVYGPGVRANFLALLRALDRGRPIPGTRGNARDFVYLGNLVDAITACLVRPAAAGVYAVRDGQTVSTAELVAALAGALGRRPRLLTLPAPLLTFAAALSGRRGALERLAGSLRVDDTRIRKALGWRPPFTLQQGLQETAAWFIATHR